MQADSNVGAMHRFLCATFSVATCLLCGFGCHQAHPVMTQLQVRQLQTRHFQINDPKRAVKAVLDVLQDEGFIPKEVNADVGFIYAVREVDVEDSGERFWANFWHGRRDARWKKNSIIECAANVTKRSHDLRVRLSLQVKVIDNSGNVQSVGAIYEPRIYQSLFSRIDKGIFLEKEGV